MCLSATLTWACGHVALSVPVRCDASASGQCQGVVERQNPGGHVEYDCPACKANASMQMPIGTSSSANPLGTNQEVPSAAQPPVPTFQHPATAMGTRVESSLGGGMSHGLPNMDMAYRAGVEMVDMVQNEGASNWSHPWQSPQQQRPTGTRSEPPVDILALHGFVDHEGEYGELRAEPKGKAAVHNPPNFMEPPVRNPPDIMEPPVHWNPLYHAARVDLAYEPPPQYPYGYYGHQGLASIPDPPLSTFPPPPPPFPGTIGHDLTWRQPTQPMRTAHGYSQTQGRANGPRHGQGFSGSEDQDASGFEYGEGMGDRR